MGYVGELLPGSWNCACREVFKP